MAPSVLEANVKALLVVLDNDIRHMQTVLQQLDQLRSLLIKRDDAGLEQLLVDLTSQAEVYAVNEQRRQTLRQALAEQGQCDIGKVTLSWLARSVPDSQRSDVLERQRKLKSLIDKLKRECALTSMLVVDCARFNQSLVRLFFGQSGRGGISYGANGAAVRRTDAALMSLHF